MARRSYGLVGLAIIFGLLIILLPISKSLLSSYSPSLTVSSFTGGGSCKAYSKPCSEGYFCQSETCVPIFPKL